MKEFLYINIVKAVLTVCISAITVMAAIVSIQWLINLVQIDWNQILYLFVAILLAIVIDWFSFLLEKGLKK